MTDNKTTSDQYEELRAESRESQNAMPRYAGAVQALERKREPLDTIKALGVPVLPQTPEQRKQIRDISRGYATTHHLVPTCIDIYSRFPIQGAELVCKDEELSEFYETLFFDNLSYDSFLMEMGKEYWTVGEVTTLGSFNEVLGVWEGEEILNPDDIDVVESPFGDDPRVRVKVPEYLKELVTGTGTGSGIQNSEEQKRRAWERQVLL
mgnify:CR=1 FL=1